MSEERTPYQHEGKDHQIRALVGDPQALARDAIQEIADSLGVEYDDLMQHAQDFLEHGEYWNEGERFDGEHIPEAFWDHYELVKGTSVNADNRWSFLSCAC